MHDLIDCHIHTAYSDGDATVAEVAQAAIAAGLSTIAITDHLARPAFMDCAVDESLIAARERDIEDARRMFPQLKIVNGFEADWYPGCETDIEDARGGALFILGSVHYLGEFAIDWDQDMRIWEQLGADAVWRRYADAWCEACFCPVRFSSMAHPDLPRLFGPHGWRPSMDMQPIWNQMAEAARESGVRVEISTAGLRKSLGDLYPCRELLAAFSQVGAPITVGSDAHGANAVGFGIAYALEQAAKAGYRSVDVPEPDGSWRSAPIG